MSKRRTPQREDVRTEYALNDDHSLVFVTSRDITTCICHTYPYHKLIARHEGTKDLEGMHESLKYLFQQYIDDIKTQLPIA